MSDGERLIRPTFFAVGRISSAIRQSRYWASYHPAPASSRSVGHSAFLRAFSQPKVP
ncbi:hypothetical protein KCP71_04030 [Salmonella enterica subsp. enterica]|nr:hypothetical protein KCP71_04030 [Salmonella enterica subsp. enterica]